MGGAYYLDVFGSPLDAQEGALQNIKGAETLCEYVLKVPTGTKIGERERLMLLADGSLRFVLVANTSNFISHQVERKRCIYESIFAVI